MTQLNQRRRGNRLENAIYDTTYTLLSQYGLDQVTFSRVATAAATSRSVLYRYWDSTFDLIFHTIIHQIQKTPISLTTTPLDTGSLRTDLILLAQRFIQQTSTGPFRYFRLLFATALNAQNQRDLTQLVTQIDHANLTLIEPLLTNAQNHGELQIWPNQAAQLVLFQQLRYCDIINQPMNTDQQLTNLIDQVVLPALRASGVANRHFHH
ncbi:TetR/AcrR family transcriptional regulator [Lactiplantibacillus plantarum]|uniref:TetR family transcriptional regulator n=1 Tax=Lactiplantibacillus plantarum TaxID=1590 RepID=UPI0007BC2A9B|nr:TetR family transcriptional regulator [Lactiplantibacillus plantarum]AYE60070.1 TetR/AcrR family transcriptional regulator [Lactiplantibacillus plantarum]KZU45716.1 putative transcriptional regulator [Lactiplantibacillus plantarum]MCG0573848.1 transcription regulator [Lactiplantibacillus plantarum]QBJ55133.1 TetR/AcrR family transcriptional regulator [Lactiplantibacillus plantarum]